MKEIAQMRRFELRERALRYFSETDEERGCIETEAIAAGEWRRFVAATLAASIALFEVLLVSSSSSFLLCFILFCFLFRLVF